MTPNIYSLVYNTLWLSTEESWEVVDKVISDWMMRKSSPREIRETFGEGIVGSVRDKMEIGGDGIARIDVSGPLAPRLGLIEKMCGATDYGDVRSEIAIALDNNVKGILMVYNSSGGTAVGCLPTMKAISQAESRIPVFGHVPTCACSAAYMMLSQSTKIHAESSAILGSIGGVVCLVDTAEQDRKYGKRIIKVTSSGAENKVMAKDGSYTEEELSRVQNMLDEMLEPILDMIDESREVDYVSLKGETRTSDRAIKDGSGLLDQLSSDEEETRSALRRYIASRS